MSRAISLAGGALSRRRLLVLSAGAALALPVARAAAVPPKKVTAAGGAFLDPARLHEIAVSFDQGDYEAMIEVYAGTGDKEWIEATVEIDGERYRRAGMRLKGNSSLGALHAGEGRAGGPGGGSADEPERLPWLIRLDRFVPDQRHAGLRELVIRSNPTRTSLNEAVSLDLLSEAGLASQLAAASAFSVNDGPAALRLVIEHPNEEWMARRFSPDGLLYKGEATGDYRYRGEDPEAYDEVFDLEAGGSGDEAADLAPLIAFLDFINNSDDATFEAELAARLDVAQFAVYLAMMELIDNFDGIDGPGNNAYLYFDPPSGQFTIVPWDMNLAFGGLAFAPGDGLVTVGEPPPGADVSAPSNTGPSPAATPAAGTGPDGAGPERPGVGPEGMVVFGAGERSNKLVERYRASADYATLIEEESGRLRTSLYESGAAAALLARWVDLLEGEATALVDQATITSEAAAVAAYFTRDG